jgi:hypothetical protein
MEDHHTDHEKQLLLRLQGGFCNRLRAIVSGVLWAEDLGRRLILYWPEEPGHLPCKLEDLIVPSSIPNLCCWHAGYLSRAHGVQSIADMEAVLKVMGNAVGEIRIESYSAFHPDIGQPRGLAILRSIRIQPKICEIAENFWASAGGRSDMIGIHFRGTDHVKCLARSPFEAFAQQLEEWCDAHPEARFLLATDEPAVARALRQQFGYRVAIPVEVRGRRGPEQQILGVVDWLLLQKCQMIWGSAGSSFNELAAARSGAPLVAITIDATAN